MRILIVTHAVVRNDGQGRVNYEIVRVALDAGHTVTLLATRIAPDLASHPRLRFVAVEPSRLPSRLLQYQAFAVRTAAWIRAHRAEFDIVHVNGFITWARSDVNTVHFVHGGWYRSGFYPFRMTGGPYDVYQVLYTRLNQLLEKWAFSRARTVVSVSAKVRDEVRACGVDAARLHVIHNGVDTAEFAPGPSERARFGLPGARFVLLFAGDLRVARKNLDTVLRALALLPDLHLAVAGILRDSPYPALASRLGVGDRVHFIGFVSDMPALMRSVDAFVFPSRYEAMSLAMLEALAAALPVVTAKTAGGAEVIEPSCGVVLDDPQDADGLARAIARIAADREHAAQMGRAARALATTLGWGTMAQRYLSLYESLCVRREDARAPVGAVEATTAVDP